MIYVTGDLHREVDIDKLYKIAKLDTVPNIVLIADDFGGGQYSAGPLKMAYNLNSTTGVFKVPVIYSLKIITCPSNHENYDTISMLPKTKAYGGRTVKLYDNIELLDRGYFFTIEDKKIFSQGGAMSSDKQFRT